MQLQRHSSAQQASFLARPFLKWAGGKTQLLGDILPKLPATFGKYIEPFIGGGAVFFGLAPRTAVIADINPELVNAYRCVRDDVEAVIAALSAHKNDEAEFYRVRAQRFDELNAVEAAARTIYLNRTCFNGLYRVNKQGHFNAPFGRYANPTICSPETLRSASAALQGVEIRCADYKTVLRETAVKGDVVFLDPPYLPVSRYADFKRYAKEGFDEDDQRELAAEVERLQKLGCHVVLTNSNHPLVHELYGAHEVEVVSSKRNINSKAGARTGEDVIVTVQPLPRALLRPVPDLPPDQVSAYPSTRYMGSKEKLLPYIRDAVSGLQFDSVVDLFAGTGIVGYMFKALGKQVVSNDYMAMSSTFAKAMIENNEQVLPLERAEALLDRAKGTDTFVERTFQGLYYTDEENRLIDTLRHNIAGIRNEHQRAIAMAALIRACLKKRARGIFTYTGLRYDDGRADLRMPFAEQFLKAVEAVNAAVFDNGYQNVARRGDAMSMKAGADLVYLDPPYYSPLSDNEYVRRYHFVEGLARNWEGVELQEHTKTKKFKSYPTPFSSRSGALDAFDALFRKLRKSILVVSYSSNSMPTREEIVELMSRYKSKVEVIDIDYRYSFANQGHKTDDNRNAVKEYLFVGY